MTTPTSPAPRSPRSPRRRSTGLGRFIPRWGFPTGLVRRRPTPGAPAPRTPPRRITPSRLPSFNLPPNWRQEYSWIRWVTGLGGLWFAWGALRGGATMQERQVVDGAESLTILACILINIVVLLLFSNFRPRLPTRVEFFAAIAILVFIGLSLTIGLGPVTQFLSQGADGPSRVILLIIIGIGALIIGRRRNRNRP